MFQCHTHYPCQCQCPFINGSKFLSHSPPTLYPWQTFFSFFFLNLLQQKQIGLYSQVSSQPPSSESLPPGYSQAWARAGNREAPVPIPTTKLQGRAPPSSPSLAYPLSPRGLCWGRQPMFQSPPPNTNGPFPWVSSQPPSGSQQHHQISKLFFKFNYSLGHMPNVKAYGFDVLVIHVSTTKLSKILNHFIISPMYS